MATVLATVLDTGPIVAALNTTDRRRRRTLLR